MTTTNTNGQYVTIQGTSKTIKIVQLLGVTALLLAPVMCSADRPEASAFLWISGFITYVAARVAKWWQHD